MYGLIDAIKNAMPYLEDYANEPPDDADDDYIASLDAVNEQLKTAMEPHAEYIFLHRNEVDDLKKAEFKLRCLENTGVDNWEGYDSAMEVFNKGDK